jgi:leucyl aminopeptidase
MDSPVQVELTAQTPETQAADLLAVPFAGSTSALLRRLDVLFGASLARVIALGEGRPEAGACVLVYPAATSGATAARVALVGVGAPPEVDADAIRAGAAAAARAARELGGTLVWAFDGELPIGDAEQIRAVVEGVLLGGHDPGRWKTTGTAARLERLLVAGVPEQLRAEAARAEVVARWTNRARELVDGPPNEVTPEGLACAASTLLEPRGVEVEILELPEIERLGLGALTAVGRGSVNTPRLIVLRYRNGGANTRGLVGKAITFDSGGFFLKPQDDIVRQKADMGGGAAVIAAVGAVAELEIPLDLVAVVPAAENMIGGAAYRPGDIITTASGLTVEVTNPDAEGRLVMADALSYAKREGATTIVDIATLTGAMRAGMGDLYSGVFANDDALRSDIVAAGEASGDYAWPWPLHRRYRRLLDSPLADLRNTAGRTFGYPIIAATFLERFVGETPWAHVDIYSTAYLDEERDYLARGATGAGVRLLVELLGRFAAASGA